MRARVEKPGSAAGRGKTDSPRRFPADPNHGGYRLRSNAKRHPAIPEQSTKVGIISPVLLPDYVALLPELTTSMPAHIASSTGIDALCHLIECYTSTVANPVSDNVALTGLRKLLHNLDVAVNQPHNLNAKLEMLWASYYGGAAIAHAGTHGTRPLLPAGRQVPSAARRSQRDSARALYESRSPHAVEKFARVWDLIPDADRTLSDDEKSHALVAYFTALVKRLNLPDNFGVAGRPRDDVPALSEAALNVKRLMNNAPCVVSHDDVQQIYYTLFPQH